VVTVERRPQPRKRTRAGEAAMSLGPVGRLFGSSAVARLRVVFLQQPGTRLTLGQIRERTGQGAKGTVQAGIRTLMASGLVRREGSGNRTVYWYDADGELGQRMLELIQASHREETSSPKSVIPWLEGAARQTQQRPAMVPFGRRTDDAPSSESTQHVLATGELVENAARPRSRPGLRTRA
jgi:hypothetical protein